MANLHDLNKFFTSAIYIGCIQTIQSEVPMHGHHPHPGGPGFGHGPIHHHPPGGGWLHFPFFGPGCSPFGGCGCLMPFIFAGSLLIGLMTRLFR